MKSKTLIIDKCNHCRWFDDNWGIRCFHPKIVKPHPEGKVPKYIMLSESDQLHSINFPQWCPLEDASAKTTNI